LVVKHITFGRSKLPREEIHDHVPLKESSKLQDVELMGEDEGSEGGAVFAKRHVALVPASRGRIHDTLVPQEKKALL
jgi:hypothetical protein